MARPPLADLALANLSQLAHSRRLTRDHALHHLDSASNYILSCNLVCNGLGLYLDDADSWIVLATIVCPITEISKPSFQSWRVVFLDSSSVGEDTGFAGDGSPFAAAVEEGDVDGVIGGDVVGLARFSVGVEDKVDTARFLWKVHVSGGVMNLGPRHGKRTFAAKAMHLETRRSESLVWVVIMPNLEAEIK